MCEAEINSTILTNTDFPAEDSKPYLHCVSMVWTYKAKCLAKATRLTWYGLENLIAYFMYILKVILPVI